jgi:hypothetical protein
MILSKFRQVKPAIKGYGDAFAFALERLHVVQHPGGKDHELSCGQAHTGNLISIGQGNLRDAGVDVHQAHEHGIDEAQQSTVRLPRVMLSRINAVNATPGGIGMIVQTEKSTAPADMKPTVIVDFQTLDRRCIVAVELTDEVEQLIPTESLQFLNGGIGFPEQVEVALEHRRIAFRQGPGIGGSAALFQRREQALQSRIERRMRCVVAERERHGKHVDEFGCGHTANCILCP